MSGRRVLHCIPGMGGGGAERQLTYLASRLPGLGWDLHVALASHGPNWRALISSGARVHQLSLRNNHDPRLFLQLGKIIDRVRPDIVQVWMRQMEVAGGLVAAVKRLPWILSERSCAAAYPPGVKSLVRMLTASTASAIVSNSRAGDSYWESRARTRTPRYVVANALPLERIASALPANPAELGLPADRPVILFAGRFSPEKDVETLLRALDLVFASSDAVCVLAGEGPLRNRIEALAAKEALTSRLRIPGYLENVWGWMKRAAVLVAPSLFEGQPNAVLEAMACGCPIIASDIEAHRAFLDENTSVLVPPNDAGRLASSLLGLLAAPGVAASRAERAARTAQQWGIDNIAREYARVYEEVLSATSARRR